MKRAVLLIITGVLFLSLTGTLKAQSKLPESYEITCEFLPEHASYKVYEIPNNSFMRGKALVKFPGKISHEPVFYLHGELWIDSILTGNKHVKYSSETVLNRKDYSNVCIRVKLEDMGAQYTDSLEIYYSGYFNASKARSLSDYMRINKKDGVLLRSFGYSLWFPVFENESLQSYYSDFKEVKIITPPGYQAVVCGDIKNNVVRNNKRICTWIPGYTNIRHVQCVARKYEILNGPEVDIYYLGDSDSSGEAKSILEYSARLRKLFSENLRDVNSGSKVIVCEMPEYGDISSNNVIGLSTDRFNSFNNDIWSKSTLAHEMLHPYVHIPVKEGNPLYALVIEGFPGFMQFYAMERLEPGSSFDINKRAMRLHRSYLQKKKTGKTSRGFVLPEEKPVLEISGDEIGLYKDVFVLNDRVSLFMIYLWNKMGDKKYDQFLHELFNMDSINYASFENLILDYIPACSKDLEIWLSTTRYPERFYPF